MYAHIRRSNDQQELSSKLKQQPCSHLYDNKVDNCIKECFNSWQSKLHDVDIYQSSSSDLYRTTTPISRDSGIPIPSLPSSSSSCCSSLFERPNIPRYSFTPQIQSEGAFEFFLHPPTSHLSHPTSEPMSYIYDTTRPNSSPKRTVHWNDELKEVNHFNSNHIKKNGPHITLSTSLPFYSKVNIRIRRHRNDSEDSDQVQATARINRIDSQHDHEHIDALRQAYFNHYSTLSPTGRSDSPIEYNQLPSYRRISLPITLPVHQQLFLYIRNGQVFGRC